MVRSFAVSISRVNESFVGRAQITLTLLFSEPDVPNTLIFYKLMNLLGCVCVPQLSTSRVPSRRGMSKLNAEMIMRTAC